MSWTHDVMAARYAQELRDGYYINLHIGIPTLMANHVPEGIEITRIGPDGDGLTLIKIAPGCTLDQIRARTGAAFRERVAE